MSNDSHPELSGASSDDRPVRHPMKQRMMRVVIVIGVLALVVPGVLTTIATQLRTADAACRIVVQAVDPRAAAAIARFELVAPEGPGWYCYAQQLDGREVLLRALGLIPGLDQRPVPGTPA